MSPAAFGFALVAVGYLVGSVPFGYLCGRLVRGIDIRQHGSGNIGATNVGRVLGGKWGLLVLALDALKGILPISVVAPLLREQIGPAYPHWRVAAGIATILGHTFPCWLGFRGGKGVATALGVAICLGDVWSTLAAATVFLVSFGLWRYMSLSSIVAAIVFGACQLVRLQPSPFTTENWSVATFSILVPLLIIVRHRSNIGRLWRGEEQRFRAASG